MSRAVSICQLEGQLAQRPGNVQTACRIARERRGGPWQRISGPYIPKAHEYHAIMSNMTQLSMEKCNNIQYNIDWSVQ